MIFKQNIPVKSKELHTGTSSLDTRTKKGFFPNKYASLLFTCSIKQHIT